MSVSDHHVVVNYIIHRDWKIEKELATDAIAYCQLRESNKLDSSKRSHVLLDKTSWRKKFHKWNMEHSKRNIRKSIIYLLLKSLLFCADSLPQMM